VRATDSARLGRHEASAIFDAVRAGTCEHLGVLEGEPLLVIDLDADPEGSLSALPELLASVVVGVGTRPATHADLAGLDLVLGVEEGPGGVGGAHPSELLSALREAVERSPLAAVTLVQVLRASSQRGTHEGLLYESLAYSTLQASPEHRRWLAGRPEPAVDAGAPELVRLERRGAELRIELNRPARRNALGSRLRDALCEALDLATAQVGLERITLRGAGPDFSSGGDLTEFGLAVDPALAHLVRVARSPGARLAAMRGLFRAEVHGACIGAGIELPAFAHELIADPASRFRLPELAMGLIPGAGGTVSIPRRIGRHRTAWMALSGEEIPAPRALAWGLVDALEPIGLSAGLRPRR
jgi:enoyl-CoA hydratase/carnithine racemase